MGFADALGAEVERPIKKGPLCSIHLTLEQMSEKDANALLAALDDPRVGHSVIEATLISEGYRVGRDAIQRHRRSLCQCWKFRDGVR